MTDYLDDDDLTLQREIRALEDEKATLRRKRKPFRADAHLTVDATVQNAKETIDHLLLDSLYRLVHSGGEPVRLTGLADAWVLATQPDIAKRWHAVIDAPVPEHYADPFGTMDRPEYEQRTADLTAAIEKRERVLHLRGLTRMRDAAAKELAGMEAP